MEESATHSNFFSARMEKLGVTEENNQVQIWKTQVTPEGHKAVLEPMPIFKELPEGIEILVYTLDRLTYRIEKNGSRMKKDFSIVRLEKPLVKANGDTMKYRLPKGAGTHPFFPVSLIEKFEKKTPIQTLFLVEGYFKAFKADMHGLDIIGLSSITHMKDKDKGTLHPEIIELMKACDVRRMVWLTDGDALDVTQKEISDGLDLSKRPKQFFNSVETFRTLLADYEIEKWFMHIDTDNILENNKELARDDVKGIDDLLISFKDKEQLIIDDIKSMSKQSAFFQKFNITYGTHKVYNHFRLRDIKEFYLFHVERRPEIKGKEFIFNGTRYQYDEEKGECLVKIPGDAKLYFRVADNYFKFVNLPNQYKQLERVFHERKKATITDDHGRGFATHIPKYEAFCNVPDHSNFQQVIHNCFNVYSPIDYLPDDELCTEEDFPTIRNFLFHLFGENLVNYFDNDHKEKREYKTVELAYDYLQLLYQKPWQKLPIICLVSRENNTGKSTFANFLRLMLGANVAIVGNADLVNDFNAHWATKSVVVCDETKIDKQHVIEKIKSLSTAKKIFMNAKGRGQVELDCFIKFVLITNNEENFIYASDEDIRYWIIKVPVLEHENPNILDQFVEEIPSFLSYLNKRKLATELKNRMWFHPALLKTEALKKVIAYSQPTIVKELRQFFKELFLDTGLDEILMTQSTIWKAVFKERYERNYLENALKNVLKVSTYHVWVVDDLDEEFKTEDEATTAAQVKHPQREGFTIKGVVKTLSKVVRYTYPSWQETIVDGKKQMQRCEISDIGRPYVFYRKDFVKPEESAQPSEENKFISENIIRMNGNANGYAAYHGKTDDMPF